MPSNARELIDMYGPDYIDVMLSMANEPDPPKEQWELDLEARLAEVGPAVRAALEADAAEDKRRGYVD